ncbi:TOPRIM nucleotidyl transferase/hydrolase domain-containing protein [Streptomyces viridosporus]|uniref:TOPRIM nucleotidyl transferase/hydrolase domain-containing protein n=1 Tax=Streptomyces viridosporus TaxID=67581 RepID=UPI003319694B
MLLVEGPSDHFLVPHLACTLSLQWGFDKQGAAIAKGAGKGKGKGGIARYRNFFRRFEMRVAVLANPDAVLDEFDKLGAVSECHELRDRVVARVNLLAEDGRRSRPCGRGRG